MHPSLTLTQKQTQQLSLTPQMRQSLEILQLDTLALREKIFQALETNPMLEIAAESEETPSSLEETTWEWADIDGELPTETNPEPARADPLAAFCYRPPGLSDALKAQIGLLRLHPTQKKIADYIIDSLDTNGWLPETPLEISQALGIELPAVTAGIHLVQSLEPAGVACADLRECLRLQALRLSMPSPVLEIIEHWLPALADNKIQTISRALGLHPEEVRKAADAIRSLHPRPGAAFSAEKTVYIFPDARLEWREHTFQLSVGNPYLPTLQLSTEYQNLLATVRDPQVNAYLSQCLKQARALLLSIAQRNQTLSLCIMQILQFQPDYFYNVQGHLQPMTMGQIAEALQINVSTVSRAMKDKYIQCCHGIVPLQSLFTTGLPGGPHQSLVSSHQIEADIRRYILQENKDAPFSDQEIAEYVTSAGTQIARRTVAKYRSRLGIPPASQRKQNYLREKKK